MNWLIIAPDVKNEHLKVIEEFLEVKHDIIPYEIFITEHLPKDDLYHDIKHILQTTHCIILNSSQMDTLSDYIYILGALSGKGVKTFIYAGSSNVKRYETLDSTSRSLFHCYSTIDEMLNVIDENFDDYLKRDSQKQALLDLFTSGIPFNADSFAYYVAKDDAARCELFLKAGMLPNAKNSEGVPVICVAARNDCLNRIKWLLDNGADIDAISTDRGYSAVMDAVWRKNYDTVKFLVEKGAKLNFISTDGQPLLVLAVGNGDEKIIQLLLEHGADPDIKDAMNMSARAYAKLFKKQSVIDLFENY